jgi:hypothetical protein
LTQNTVRSGLISVLLGIAYSPLVSLENSPASCGATLGAQPIKPVQ